MHHILEDERTAPTVVGGRYLPQRLLKAAHGLSTWVAADLETGRSVVVKTTPLAAVPEGTELVLRHEAAVLASVECPHLAPLLDVGVDADALYLVTPYVPGVSLDRRLRVGPLDVDDALTLARSVAAALAAVWERGVLHRDIKPSSIVVNEGAPLAAVTLIDFGFSRADAVETSLRGDAPTVARYVSPERAGLVDLDVDQRSDLYSLGAVLFEALAGRPPYSGSSVREILRHHVTAPIPSLRSFGLTVPRAVDEIVQRLLAKDPADRYQTPEALLADLATVSDALRAGHADPAVVIGTHDRRCCVVGQPAFVGRGVELSGLAAALDEAAAGRPALVALEAASGGGKTRLLDEFAQQAAERGAWVVRGRALDQVATLPFQPLQGIAAAFEAERDPDTVGRIAAEFGAHAHAAVAALPSLADVFPVVAEEVLGPEAYGETRTVDALAALLAALGDHERPAVVLLDDLQWTDRLTCAVLARWQRETRETGRGHVLVVAAYRGEDVGLGHPVLDLAPDRRLNLAPLADIDLRRLVESMAGAIDGDARDTVVSLAEGSPFMASAVLHGLVEADALVCRHPGWVLDPDRMDEMQSSRRSAAFLARRLDLLPPATLELLLAAAVLGREFDLDLAAHLAGQPADTAVPALHDARRRHLIWSRSQAGRSTFVHDRIRETLLARLHPDERRSLHSLAAERIAGTHPERIFDLAYHFAAADRPDRAFAYALAAAEQARDQYALDVAEQHYKIAARAVDGADRATQRRVSAGLGEVLTLAGRYDDARRHLDAALELSDEPLAEAELHAQRADLAFKAGELGDAADAAERGLRLLRRRVPRTTAGFVLSVVVEAVVQTLHSLAARWFVARRPLDGRATADLLACRLYSRLAHVAWFVRGPVPTLWAHLREMNLAERYPPTRELAQAYSEHAPASTLVGWHRRGIAYATRSLAIRRRLHDVWGQGQSLNFYGIVLYTAARYTESMEKGREAVRLLQRTGDRWELNIARCHVAYNLMRTGRIAEAVDVAREVHRHGVDIGDREAVAVALDVWAKASGGQAPADAIAAELARPTIDVQRRSHLLQAEAVRLLRAGRPLEAADLLEGAIRETNAAGVRNEYVVAARPWLATALREAVEAMSPYAAGRRPLLRRATRAARAARILARVFPNHRSHALREAGLVAALLGRSRTARRLLLAALEVAQHSGAVTEEFECLEAFEDVAAELGWEIDPAHAARADDLRLRLDIPGQIDVKRASPVTLGLLDRFDTLLDEGRRIAGALSEAVAHRSATRALRNLLRADETSFVDLSRNEAQHAAAALVREAIERRRPVVVDDDPADERADDLLPAGARCALAVPVLVRGEPVGCLYAGHGAMSGMFREDDVRVAELVASITGAALENAQGFAEIEALQRSLEERVSDRTAQLSTMLRELERVNEELRDADRLKTDFVSMVSHELRTPLTPIIGLSSTMLQRWGSMDDALREECLVSIHRQGTRLARLVDDLLEMSRIESGALEAEASIFDVRPVVEAAVASMGDEFSLITVECPDGLQMVTDVDRFHQMLVNYLENARKYGDGPIVVTARSRGEWVEVAVADSGDGVPEEFVGKLFEKFTRFGGSDASGTGLGLSIVRGLARAQGGDAWYEPNRPRGARFCIRLPRAARNVLGDFANGDVASDPGANVSA